MMQRPVEGRDQVVGVLEARRRAGSSDRSRCAQAIDGREVLRHGLVVVDLGRQPVERQRVADDDARREHVGDVARAILVGVRRRGTTAASRGARSPARWPRRRDARAATGGTPRSPWGGAARNAATRVAVADRRACIASACVEARQRWPSARRQSRMPPRIAIRSMTALPSRVSLVAM